MIGDFRYQAQPGGDCISVKMSWKAAERMAILHIPSAVALELENQELYTAEEPMKIACALSYAVFLSMQTGHPLRISGDFSVWDARWGVH